MKVETLAAVVVDWGPATAGVEGEAEKGRG